MKPERNALCPCGSGKKYKHCCHRATPVAAQPSQAEVDTLMPLFNAGHYSALESATQAMLANYPNAGILWKILGTSLHLQKKNAVAALSKAAELSPEDAEVFCNLGAAYQEAKQTEQAFQHYRHALALRPDYPEALNNYGTLLKDAGHHLAAVEAFTHALELQPDNADAHGNLGLALMALNELDLAMPHLERAVDLQPQSAITYFNLGTAWHKQLQTPVAIACFQHAVSLSPAFFEAHNALGNALRDSGQINKALESLLTADRLSPNTAEIVANLASAYHHLGLFDEAADAYRRALQLKPDSSAIYSSLLFCLSHCEGVSSARFIQEHWGFGDRFEAPHRARWPSHANSRIPDRPLEVGFVSGDFRNHALANFIEPIFQELAKMPGIHLHAYYNHVAEEALTHRLKQIVPAWHRVSGLSEDELAAKIQADNIDILIDLSGHTALHRLECFARKPAPIQCSWMGYPGTTGLQSIDYYIADPRSYPYDLFHHLFSESLLHLPTSAPFSPSELSPDVAPLPALANGFLTFGSFNRPNKISRSVLALWASALRALPGSQLLLAGLNGDDDSQQLTRWLADEGIESDRLRMHSRYGMEQYLALHHEVDICLDTFPYNGGTTTLHALWMGVPTLSRTGELPASRSGASILSHLDLTQFIAQDTADFVAKAGYWGSHLDELGQLRAELRERVRREFVGTSVETASALEKAMRLVWHRWCEGHAQSYVDMSLHQ